MLATTLSDTRDAILAIGSVALAVLTFFYLRATRDMATSTKAAADAAGKAAKEAAASTAVSFELLEIERARRAEEVERATAEANAELARLARSRRAAVQLSMTGPNHLNDYTLIAHNGGEHVASDVRLEIVAGPDTDVGGRFAQDPPPFNLQAAADWLINVVKLSGSNIVVAASWIDGEGPRSDRPSVMFPS